MKNARRYLITLVSFKNFLWKEKMKLVDISMNCYAHLIENRIYLYVDDAFSQILYVDDVENLSDPIPYIMREIELSSQASLYECMQFIH